MKTAFRAVVTLLVLAVAMAAGTTGVHAADPMLGASFGPAVLYGSDQDPALLIINRSDLPVLAAVSLDEGWQAAQAEITLAADESVLIPISRVGERDGHATLDVEAAMDQETGTVAGAISLQIRLVVQRPIDWASIAAQVLVGLALVVGLALTLWKIKPWKLRLTRAA